MNLETVNLAFEGGVMKLSLGATELEYYLTPSVCLTLIREAVNELEKRYGAQLFLVPGGRDAL